MKRVAVATAQPLGDVDPAVQLALTKSFWDDVRRLPAALFTAWDQVLVRMNAPPQPLPF